ncbi:hypothetical protein GCM10010156_13570 [Planobispora rosea]|uniref:Uncharacterized protein n=1 Tax=Planobispora rosea TaxID=35762 RepID=A0A8J3S0B4_PLARO|nr:hypothetical protein GCM10010156_13570 [Planobispora rosea]GIH83571.1 hypothetical protein Pro02_19790 [Planobispora rosea]
MLPIVRRMSAALCVRGGRSGAEGLAEGFPAGAVRAGAASRAPGAEQPPASSTATATGTTHVFR